jgi:hypothetical protein
LIRKPKQKKLEQISGWFEILFRFRSIPVLKRLDDLDADDYMMVGRPMPLQEFDGTYEAYTVLHNGGLDINLPRPLQEYDIMNMVYRIRGNPVQRVSNILLIDDSGNKNCHLIHPDARLQWQPGYPLAQLPLRGTIIPSKYERTHI